MKYQTRPNLHATKLQPQYALRKIGDAWELTFKGNNTRLKQEEGLKYVAYLLLNPSAEPLFALDLACRADVFNGERNAINEIVHPYTGEIVIVPVNARIQERHLALEDAETMRFVLRKQRELEALLDDPDLIEPVRAEIHRELIELYDYEKLNTKRILDAAQQTVRTVRRAITRLHHRLAKAVDVSGYPHPVLRSFALHLKEYLIGPSSRYIAPAARRANDEAAGCFTYQPPKGIVWNR